MFLQICIVAGFGRDSLHLGKSRIADPHVKFCHRKLPFVVHYRMEIAGHLDSQVNVLADEGGECDGMATGSRDGIR